MRLLVAEDDIGIAEAVKTYLKSEGYGVDVFNDPEDAYRHARLNHGDYDLFVFDVMMPGKSGIELCRDLRKAGVATPVLMLTALESAKDKVTALDSGADDYLTKPFSIDELGARVRALLRRPRVAPASVLDVGPLSIDRTSKRLLAAGKPIELTLKEFGILEYLAVNAGMAVPKDVLLDHVWDIGFSSMSNVIEVHVNSLRAKLRARKLDAMIKTVRGVGYMLEPNPQPR